jgi:hypothetical protein
VMRYLADIFDADGARLSAMVIVSERSYLDRLIVAGFVRRVPEQLPAADVCIREDR